MMEQQERLNTQTLLLLIAIAYLFSLAVRMIWVYQFQDNPAFYWNDQLMINTNDGYYFASGAQKVLYGMHLENPRIPSVWSYGTVALTVLLTKLTPFSLETIILYMPAFISSLVVIPIILIARLFNLTLWGFFSALLGSIAWSYYNRTMTGYYDTDMFSAMAPMFILYFLMKSTIVFNLRSALYAALVIAIYPFLYDSGASIVYAMGTIYALYMIYYHRHEATAYHSVIMVFLALVPLPLLAPYSYMVKLGVLIGVFILLKRMTLDRTKSLLLIGILFLLFMYFGNVLGLILSKIAFYTAKGTTDTGLHFYSVSQTIREAGKVLFFPLPEGMPYKANIAHRMMGSSFGLVAALVGYIILVIRYRAFILALPLIGIGVFAHWGGLRFTVYAVPVAAMSAVYLFWVIGEYSHNKRLKYALTALATVGLLYPNVMHIIGYKVPTVMNKAEVQDLDRLRKISDPKDYTLAWWDYGYPLWFYSDTNTIIDGAKHQNDNFIISTIMQTDSPELAAHLSRVSVETYVDSNYSNIADTLFKNKQKDQRDPNVLLAELEDPAYKLPKKTRDVYLYMPYRMLNIFPTVAVFGNLDLTTGQPERKMMFSPARVVGNKKGILQFSNGIVFDTQKGELYLGEQRVPVKQFIIAQLLKDNSIRTEIQPYHEEGRYVVVYMKSYGEFVIMDETTYHSMYVQMFMLGRYDKDLFELVVTSPYSRIYKVKR